MRKAIPSWVSAVAQSTAWRIIAILSIVEAGAYIGNESARYFWDLAEYVYTLDLDNPYQPDLPLPFLYPPSAADLFLLARSHLFELLSIAYVAATVLFLWTFTQLNIQRRFEWLLAIFAMGGLGVISVQSGNVGTFMNLTVLALALQAAMGKPTPLLLLPVVIGFGGLIKPQFVLYVGLLPFLDESRTRAFVKMVTVCVAVICVHATYVLFRPVDWNRYVQGAIERTVVRKDFGWGPAEFADKFTDSNAAALAAYIAGFLIVAALAYAAWKKSVRTGQPIPRVALVSLAFFVLAFANPRMPIYDLFTAAIALIVCCGLADRASILSWALVLALAINLNPWLIANFARTPSAYPEWIRNLQNAHLLGIAVLLVALVRVGIRPAGE